VEAEQSGTPVTFLRKSERSQNDNQHKKEELNATVDLFFKRYMVES